MADERTELDELFCQAVALTEPERSSFVHAVRDRDHSLGEDLRVLLEADASVSFEWNALPMDLSLDLVLDSARDREQQRAAEAARVDPLVGTTIHNYRIDGRIGGGGMGVVYRATHLALQKTVALKLLRADVTDDVGVQRFNREMQAAGKLDHPHVVRATDGGEFDGRQFMVMDFLDGVDLGTLVRTGGPLSVADASEAVRQAACGLQHAFEQGLTHRDIKPSNLFLTREGTVKVVDFGLASLRDAQGELTTQNDVFGTADYMAPEQWEDARSAGVASDVYSLCCTLFHLLVGHPPFRDDNTRSLPEKMRAHLHRTPADLRSLRDDVPDALASLVSESLSKDPRQRPAAHSALADGLEPFAVGASLVERPEAVLGSQRQALADTARSQGRLVDTVVPVGGHRAQEPASTEAIASRVRRTVFAGKAGPVGCSVVLTLCLMIMIPLIGDFGATVVSPGGIESVSRPVSENTESRPDSVSPLAQVEGSDRVVNLLQFEITHLADTGQEYVQSTLDVLGRPWSETVRLNDRCGVFVQFDRPVYCYLVALNPDGVVQLCHPESPTGAPTRQARFEYPRDNAFKFPFTDGRGQQAFVIVAAKTELPSWTGFQEQHDVQIPWQPNGTKGRWRFNIERLRGAHTETVSPQFQASCEYLDALPGVDEVFGVAFPVE